MNGFDWANFLDQPDPHVGVANRGAIAFTLRAQAARISALEAAVREVSRIDRECKSEYDAPNALTRAGVVARAVMEAE